MADNPYHPAEAGRRCGSIGWRVHYFQELETTQRTAGELAARGALNGEVVIAERQTAGRGRMGRTWHSPPGVNFYGTFILRPEMPVAEAALAHKVPDAVIAAYKRTTFLELRKKLMDDWAAFATSDPVQSADVIPIRSSANAD